jgi:flagellar M-ring protein FliF
MVDGKYDNEKYVARSAEEMEIIKGIVKRAVGFDTDRGDEIEIANVPFKIQPASPLNPLAAPTLKDMAQTPMGMAAGGGALLVLGTLAFFMLRRKKPRASATEPAAAMAVLPTEPSAGAAAVQEEVAAAAQKIVVSEDPRKEQLAQIAHDYHDASVRIIRTWLQEDAAKARAAAASGGIMPTRN